MFLFSLGYKLACIHRIASFLFIKGWFCRYIMCRKELFPGLGRWGSHYCENLNQYFRSNGVSMAECEGSRYLTRPLPELLAVYSKNTKTNCFGVPPASIHLGRFREDLGICDFYYNYELIPSARMQMYFGFPFSL